MVVTAGVCSLSPLSRGHHGSVKVSVCFAGLDSILHSQYDVCQIVSLGSP